jgi:SagB-type dehydrogenase family enzyme
MDTSIHLPQPQTTGGMPLLDCLRERHSTREYLRDEVPLQELSNLLWAAFGLTRPDAGTGVGHAGSHTAPCACNSQSIDIYVGLSQGLYLYEPHAHELQLVLAEDVRPYLDHPMQTFVLDAPVHLFYVVDYSRMVFFGTGEWDKQVFPFADSAFMAENVYLYCAAAGLATVIRALLDRTKLAEVFGLRADQYVTLSQTIGHGAA